jgi:hypothetical protein
MKIVPANLGDKFDEDAQTHFDLLSGTFDAQLRHDLNELIVGLKTDSLWTKIDVLCVAHNDETDTLRNIRGVANGADTIKAGSPTFAANQGFTMSNENNLDTQESETSATLYGQYDGHAFVYVNTHVGAGSVKTMIGLKAGQCFIYVDETQTPDDLVMYMQNKGRTFSGDNPVGFFGMAATAIDQHDFRYNDTTDASVASQAYTIEASNDINVGQSAGGAQDCDEEIACWGFGGGLTAAELALYEDRIRTYAQRRGFDVY